MLIVLGIIAALFAMLVPGLLRAKEMAKKVYCMNNLNQTFKVIAMYNNDQNVPPYSSIWLVDFSFLTTYIESTKDKYGIMECPDTSDNVNSSAELIGGTSYHYMGSRWDWQQNNLASGDGSEYGFDASNPSIINHLTAREEKLVYDKSDTVHYGRFNVVHVESGHVETIPYTQRTNYWFLTPAGTLNFDASDIPDRSKNLNQDKYAGKFDTPISSEDDSSDEGENGEKITIIHYPPGNPDNPQIISISRNAWPAHEAHGDEIYTGQQIASSGTPNREQNQEENQGNTTQNMDQNQDTYNGEELTDDGNDNANDNANQEGTDKAKNNNGHGNNADGVDCSNPGKAPFAENDTDPTVDDESKGGGSSPSKNKNK